MATNNSKVVKVKGWAVLWIAPNAGDYGLKHGTLVINASEEEGFSAVFSKLNEAEKWHGGNVDWKIVPITISYSTPIKGKGK